MGCGPDRRPLIEEAAAEQFRDGHQPEAAFAKALDDAGKGEWRLGVVATVVHQDDRPGTRRVDHVRLHPRREHMVVVARVEGPEDRLQVIGDSCGGVLGVDQAIGRAKEARREAGRFADAAIGRGELAEAGVVRMVEGVVSDLVSVEEDFLHQRFASSHVTALLEEGGTSTEEVEGFEELQCVRRARAVIECKCDLPLRGRSFQDRAAGLRRAPNRLAARSGTGSAV